MTGRSDDLLRSGSISGAPDFATIDEEDVSTDPPRVRSAKVPDQFCDFLDSASPLDRNRGQALLPFLRVTQAVDTCRVEKPGCNDIGGNVMRSQLVSKR